jgi:hypothetical protein
VVVVCAYNALPAKALIDALIGGLTGPMTPNYALQTSIMCQDASFAT